MPRQRKTRNDCVTNQDCPAKLYGLKPDSKEYRDAIADYNMTIPGKMHCDILCHDDAIDHFRWRAKKTKRRNQCTLHYDAHRNERRNTLPTVHIRDATSKELRYMLKEGLKGKICCTLFSVEYEKQYQMNSIQLAEHFLNHPEKEPWMTALNYGRDIDDTDDSPLWNIDHIKRKHKNKALSREQAIKLMHAPSNLRPIRARDNH